MSKQPCVHNLDLQDVKYNTSPLRNRDIAILLRSSRWHPENSVSPSRNLATGHTQLHPCIIWDQDSHHPSNLLCKLAHLVHWCIFSFLAWKLRLRLWQQGLTPIHLALVVPNNYDQTRRALRVWHNLFSTLLWKIQCVMEYWCVSRLLLRWVQLCPYHRK